MSIKKIKPSGFLKLLFINKELKSSQVAEKTGRSVSSLNGILRNERMNVGTLHEIMKACDEPMILVLKSGEMVELDLD